MGVRESQRDVNEKTPNRKELMAEGQNWVNIGGAKTMTVDQEVGDSSSPGGTSLSNRSAWNYRVGGTRAHHLPELRPTLAAQNLRAGEGTWLTELVHLQKLARVQPWRTWGPNHRGHGRSSCDPSNPAKLGLKGEPKGRLPDDDPNAAQERGATHIGEMQRKIVARTSFRLAPLRTGRDKFGRRISA